MHEVEVDVVEEHVGEGREEQVDGVEGPAAGEVALEVEDVEGGGEREGEGVEPGSAGGELVERKVVGMVGDVRDNPTLSW